MDTFFRRIFFFTFALIIFTPIFFWDSLRDGLFIPKVFADSNDDYYPPDGTGGGCECCGSCGF